MLDSAHDFLFREATFTDASVLAQFRFQMFSEIEDEPSTDDADAFASLCQNTFEDLLQSGACVAWIAEIPDQSEPVGTVVMLRFPRLPTFQNRRIAEGYIINVYVVPPRRHFGVATALMERAIEYSRQAGFARIRLRATAAGQPLYECVGFRGRDSVMELDLH
jgi:GNAT superfamily N-acetyltransferase